MLTYALSDIHGHLELLDQALEWINDDFDDLPHRVVFCGDYIDRGPSSRGVLDRMMEMPNYPQERVFLRGNHDDMMLQTLRYRSGQHEDIWLEHGGIGTLAEYAIPGGYDVPALERHLDFIEAMPFFYQDEHTVFTHAGLIGTKSVEDHTPNELMWTNFKTVTEHWPGRGRDKLLVHGHTSHPAGPYWRQNRICIDTGTYRSKGALTVCKIGLEGRFVTFERFERTAVAGAQNPRTNIAAA